MDKSNNTHSSSEGDSDDDADISEMTPDQLDEYMRSLTTPKIKKSAYDINNDICENPEYIPKRKILEPFTSSWVHDKDQFDDTLTDIHIQRQNTVKYLSEIEYPAQRSAEWFKQRETLISASDGGCVVDANKHEAPYKFIVKKVFGSTFKSNEFCYHGKKYELIATMIYENRMNVGVEEYGLVRSSKHKFLGASPDGIVNKYKKNGKNLTDKVGRMLEIKCPFIRKIQHDGEIIDGIVPIYYWVQVQLQLQCCELDECDFWQCKIEEYDNYDDFLNDTDHTEPFRSVNTGLEKGCVIQLVPKSRKSEMIDNYLNVIYEDAIFMYPPSIEYGPSKLKKWVDDSKKLIETDEKYKDFDFDKVFYWKLKTSNCTTLSRDDKWFNEKLPILRKMWDYVEFYRVNENAKNTLKDYLDSSTIKKNSTIMKYIDKQFNEENNKIIEEAVGVNIEEIREEKTKEKKQTRKPRKAGECV